MEVGLLSDVHGNLVALDAVLDDMPPVDAVVCAGDVVGYGPWPADCVETVRDVEDGTVSGNHDRAVASETSFRHNSMAGAGIEYAREHLTEAQMDWLDSLPPELTLFDDRLKVVHGHPDDPDRYTYPRLFSADLLDDEDVLVMGHTHVQAHERFDEGVVVNPGSVGQPRDEDPRAAYAVLDLDDLTVEERRVEYDVDAVIEAVDAAGLPEQIGNRLKLGR